MSKEEIMQIISNKNGELIDYKDDIFEENKIKCKDGHIFYLYTNDIILDHWCPHCKLSEDKITISLKQLGIEYESNFVLNDLKFSYRIKGQRKILIDNIDDESKIRISQKNNYNLIIIIDDKIDNLKELLWKNMKDNKQLSYIGKKDKVLSIHQCDNIKKLDNENDKDDSGSVIKYANEPYPELINKAIGYVRVSTVMQVNDGFSLEAQESKIISECEKNNLFLRSIYIDKGISGGSLDKRLALEELRKELKEGEWIIVNSVSRLARNTKDLLSLVEEIENKKCHLIIIDLNLDITSPSGKLILTLMASQAQFERELTSERVKGVLQHLKKNGTLRTKPRFGWKLNPDHSPDSPIHIRNEEEQLVIKKIRNLRSRNKMLGIVAFARKMEENKIPPPRSSKRWYHKTVRNIMENEGIK